MELLSIHSDSSEQKIAEAFTSTKVFNWLVRSLSESGKGELYFGSVTAMLHNILCDDPSPYRCAVKDLLSTLLSYCEEYATHLVKIDRPRYSQRITLLK
jgi:hypothetical protein